MTHILVTGGAGFLGSHLCERLLADGHDVVCVDNLSTGSRRNIQHLLGHPRFEFIRQDVAEHVDVDAQQIYHLACPASPVHYQQNPVRTIRTAVHGTLNMLDLARDTGARILIASTSEVYGDPTEHPQRESYWGHVNPTGVRACYDEGKRCAEALSTCWAQQYGTQVRIARIFNTFGPRLQAHDGRVISNFIVQALRGVPLTVYGDGSHTRSFCYVDDTVEALILLMESAESTPVNIGNPQEIPIRELAQRVLSLSGSRSLLLHQPLPQDDPVRRCPDIGKARRVLDWEPRHSLEEGLRRTIAWFQAQSGAENGENGAPPRWQHAQLQAG